jgi:hypothetical protein
MQPVIAREVMENIAIRPPPADAVSAATAPSFPTADYAVLIVQLAVLTRKTLIIAGEASAMSWTPVLLIAGIMIATQPEEAVILPTRRVTAITATSLHVISIVLF